jgi:hypothetical protein
VTEFDNLRPWIADVAAGPGDRAPAPAPFPGHPCRERPLVDALKEISVRRPTLALAGIIAAILAAAAVAYATTGSEPLATNAPNSTPTSSPTASTPVTAASAPTPSASTEPPGPLPTQPVAPTNPIPAPAPKPTTPGPVATGSSSGQKNCFAQLDACGYPSKATTGVPAGTTLSAYTGPDVITKAGTIIDGKKLGCIEIRATNVVIRNSRLTNPGDCWWMVDVAAGDVTIERTTIDCVDYRTTGIAEANFVARLVQILRCENGADTSWGNITIVDSYIGDVREVDGGHGDGIQVSGGDVMRNVVLRHNTVQLLNPVTSSIEWDRMPAANVTVVDNLFSAGAYTIYCPDPSGGAVTFTGNRFGVGSHGPAYGFTDGCRASGITWTANYRDDTLAAVKA